MKKIFTLITLLLTLSSCFLLPQARQEPMPAYYGPRKPLLLAPVSGNISSNFVQGVQSELEQVLFSNAYGSRFIIVDRTAVQTALNELRLSMLGLLDDNNSIAIGRQVGAKISLATQIIDLRVDTSQGGDGKYGYYTVYTTKAQISIRMLNIETGVLMLSTTGSGSITTSKNIGRDDSSTALKEALYNATNNLIRRYAAQYDSAQ